MEATLNNTDFQGESENTKLAITILRTFIECALENEPNELELTILGKFIKTMEREKEFAEFFKEPAEEYFFIHYDDPKEAEKRYQQFLGFATKRDFCN